MSGHGECLILDWGQASETALAASAVEGAFDPHNDGHTEFCPVRPAPARVAVNERVRSRDRSANILDITKMMAEVMDRVTNDPQHVRVLPVRHNGRGPVLRIERCNTGDKKLDLQTKAS